MFLNDTIAAIATAPGTGAIAIIRLSGENSLEIADKFFRNKSDKKISLQKPYSILFGEIIDDNKTIDQVLISVFKAPNSYTGENSVEISCHGSTFIQQKILEIAIKNGARLAQPGEFTMRAFLNGKMDLSQAEAVADLIASKSEASRKVAINQLKGGFSIELQNIRNQLVNFVSLIELELDFSEEDVEFANRNELRDLLNQIRTKIKSLLDSFKFGNALKNGIPVAIIGKPNVGKSTLLNTLLKEDKAIVSEFAGTTRDAIEDTISINGILFRFIDTAGLRQTTDTIENLGIERTIDKVKKAEIILYLIDASIERKPELYDKILPYLKEKKLILLVNKIDKATNNIGKINLQNAETIEISAKFKTNIDKLEKALINATNLSTYNENDIIITNTRHFEALNNSFEASERVISALEKGLSSDLLSFDIREMLHYLGSITGEISNDEILGNIFKNFCIGK